MSLLKTMLNIELCRNAWKVSPPMPSLLRALGSGGSPMAPVIKDPCSSLGDKQSCHHSLALYWCWVKKKKKTSHGNIICWNRSTVTFIKQYIMVYQISIHDSLIHPATKSHDPVETEGHQSFSSLSHFNMPFRTTNTSTHQVGFTRWLVNLMNS